MKGFKRTFSDKNDKKTLHYRKNFKHPLIKGLHIIIDWGVITVYGTEPTNKVGDTQNGTGSDYVIITKKYTPKNLKKIEDLITR
jgi:hypothetical protein